MYKKSFPKCYYFRSFCINLDNYINFEFGLKIFTYVRLVVQNLVFIKEALRCFQLPNNAPDTQHFGYFVIIQFSFEAFLKSKRNLICKQAGHRQQKSNCKSENKAFTKIKFLAHNMGQEKNQETFSNHFTFQQLQ